MSIYCYLGCRTCKEHLFVKDADSDVHADEKVLGQFLEKHCGHVLGYSWEDDYEDDHYPSFEKAPKQTPNGRWSHGRWLKGAGEQ